MINVIVLDKFKLSNRKFEIYYTDRDNPKIRMITDSKFGELSINITDHITDKEMEFIKNLITKDERKNKIKTTAQY